MDAYTATVNEIRAYLTDQLSRTDHTFASDEDAIQRIGAFSREFVQCVNALPDAMRKTDAFQSAATKVWQRLYEHENLFVLSQAYAALDGDFNVARLLATYNDMVGAHQLTELSGAKELPLSADARADAKRARLMCVYLTRRIQTDKARNLHGFSLLATLSETIDMLLGPLSGGDIGRIDIEASAAADRVLMRRLVDVVRQVSRVYLRRFSESTINDARSPRLGTRRVFFTNWFDLTEFRKRIQPTPDAAALDSAIDEGLRETRVNESTLRAYRTFVRIIGLFKLEFQKYAQRVYFLDQAARQAASTDALVAQRHALCNDFKKLRAEVHFVTRETDDGAIFFHEQLRRDVAYDLLNPIESMIERLYCRTGSSA